MRCLVTEPSVCISYGGALLVPVQTVEVMISHEGLQIIRKNDGAVFVGVMEISYFLGSSFV